MLTSIDVDRIRAGDTRAFKTFFGVLYPKLLALACRFVDKHIAKDLVQDVFSMYWENKESIEAENIQSYLFKCVQNKCLNHIKHEAVVEKYEAKLQIAEARIASFNAQLKDNDIFRQLVARDIQNLVENSLTKLPPRCAEAFRLCFFNDLSHKQVAEVMAISPRTIETHIRQAVSFLRKDLRDLTLMLFCLIH